MPAKARVSVIVAVRNRDRSLQGCIDSVLGQTYPDKELIVMDGASTDRTIDILRANEQYIGYWESNQDRGIYHAWNKALKRVTGDWVCFLGADDRLAHDSALQLLVRAGVAERADLASGRVALVDESGNVLRIVGEPWNWERMKHRHVVAHPGMLHRRLLFERHGIFDDRYEVAGDYEFLLRLGPNIKAVFVDDVIVQMGSSGTSRTRVRKVLGESWAIQARHPEIGPIAATGNYVNAFSKGIARRVLRLP